MKDKAVEELGNYKHRGARALVLLHERQMRRCLSVWKQAKAAQLELPQTDDENYESLEVLLSHVLGAAQGYMVWICKQLKLNDPGIEPAPDSAVIEQEAAAYLEHLLERWRLPLAEIEEEKFYQPEYVANAGTHHLCIDIMLEHAVMHPIRHVFQLEELMRQSR